MLCPNCDYDNIPGSDLCESCGSDLAGLDLPEAGGGFAGRLMTDRVADLRLTPPVALDREATVADAIELMRRERHGCVLIEEKGRLAGIFTERDVLVRVLRRGRDPQQLRLGEVMTPDPITLSPLDPPAYAFHRMVVGGLRHLPVVDDDRLLGFVSARNLLRYLAA